MEIKSIPLEIKDVDTSKRTAIIAHAVYDSVDRVGDISTRGMFTKSWKENKSIDFLFNHNTDEIPGNALRTFEDEHKAYTEVKFGNWALGNDVMAMAEAGVIRGASFGYVTERKEMIEVKGKKVRRLKEVRHIETSLLTKMPAHPEAGIISLTKSMEFKTLSPAEQDILKKISDAQMMTMQQCMDLCMMTNPESDLYTWCCNMMASCCSQCSDVRYQLKYNSGEMAAMKSYVKSVEDFCRDTKASDSCIKSLLQEVEETKELLSEYDTASTRLISAPGASKNDSFYKQLLLLTAKFN